MDVENLKHSPQRFLNRELSLLQFNERILEEAENHNHPLLERLRFLSICASNLDEFYMVRLAGIKGQIQADVYKRSTDGLLPQEQHALIIEALHAIEGRMQDIWRQLSTEMAGHDIKIVGKTALKKTDRAFIKKYFEEEILPVLTPIALDPAHPFPFIPNKGLSIVLNIHNVLKEQDLNVLIQAPHILPRFIRLPGRHARYLLMEKAIMMNIDAIFSKEHDIREYAVFRIIRDGELEIHEEAEDLVRTFESALRRRRRGDVIRLSVHHNINPDTLSFLLEKLKISQNDVSYVNGLVSIPDCAEIINDENPDLVFKPYNARFPERIRDYSGDCFSAIRQKDIIVHHPYESFDVVVQFLRQAAHDPDVVSIKQTLYRTGADSAIVEALIEAAENGKSVTALVELKARFDEEANIRWAQNMERAGVQIVYGFLDLKTHAKVSLITRREEGLLRSYVHFGTGNYHPQNAKVYTDLSYFTCDKTLCQDAVALFNYMTGYALPQNLQKLAISPKNLRETLCDYLDQEIKNAQAGLPAQFWGKCNALLDAQLIDKLYEASQAGVKIDLVVRGVCTLRPGIPGLSDNIRVKSLVGRYLEHARVYCFANGYQLPSRKAKVFMASADLMTRNLNRRIEALVPITNSTVHKQVLDQIMVANLKDNKQSWLMQDDGSYIREDGAEQPFSAHEYFMQNPSLSGRGTAMLEEKKPPKLTLEDKKRNRENVT